MIWAITAAVVLAGAAVLWSIRRGREETDADPDAAEPRPDAPHDYRLAYRDSGHYGRGYILIRNADGRVFRWRTPPGGEGLLTLGVAGELDHKEALQSDAFAPGRRLSLVREPDSPHDPEGHATVIMSGDRALEVGHVPADSAPEVARHLDAGVELECISMWEVIQLEERVSLRVLLVGPDASLDRSALPEADGPVAQSGRAGNS